MSRNKWATLVTSGLLISVAAFAEICEEPPCDPDNTAYAEAQFACDHGPMADTCSAGSAATCLGFHINTTTCQVTCNKCMCIPVIDAPNGPGF